MLNYDFQTARAFNKEVRIRTILSAEHELDRGQASALVELSRKVGILDFTYNHTVTVDVDSDTDDANGGTI